MEATFCKECGTVHVIGVDNTLCPTHPDYDKVAHPDYGKLESNGPLFKECPIGCDEGYLPEAVQAWDEGGPEPECPYCSLKEKANALADSLDEYVNEDDTPTYNNFTTIKLKALKALDEYKS